MPRPGFFRTLLPFLLAGGLWSAQLRAQFQAGKMTLPQLQERYFSDNDTTYVVNFWATWCGPCVMEMPALMQFYQKTRDTNIQLLLISLDQPKYEKQVNAFLKKTGISAPVYILQGEKDYSWLPQVDPGWQGSIPATLIINKRRQKRLFREAPMQPGQLEYLLKQLALN